MRLYKNFIDSSRALYFVGVRMIRTKLLSNKDGIITWCAIVMVIMVMFIQRQYIAVMSDFLIAKYQINISKATRLVNATLYGYAVMQIPMGILLDYFGVRRVLIISWLVVCISTLVMTVTSCYGTALSMRFFIGVGMASSITSIMKVQTIWFDEHYFSHLSAGMALISNVGNLVATVPLSYLISKIGGQNTMWVISFITMVSVLLLFSFVKDKKEEIPEEINIKTSLSEVLCNRKSWSPIIIMFTFISTSTSLFGFWGIRFFSETYRLSVVDASKYMAFLSLGFMLGAPLVSIMDKIFDRNTKLKHIFRNISSHVDLYYAEQRKTTTIHYAVAFCYDGNGTYVSSSTIHCYQKCKQSKECRNCNSDSKFHGIFWQFYFKFFDRINCLKRSISKKCNDSIFDFSISMFYIYFFYQ